VHLECLMELHRDLSKQGPGSDASTLRALDALPDSRRIERILDAGCGPGRQTVALAEATGAQVVAIDIVPEFLSAARRRADEAGVGDRVECRAESMDLIDVDAGSIDLVWSEGAIYNVGFRRGLELWRPLIRKPGWVAVTELSWLGRERPGRAVEFWRNAYPGMSDIDENIASTHAAGYRVLDHFELPQSDFWDDYYDPLRARLPDLRTKWCNEPEAIAQLLECEREIALYEHYADSYGYVFYVLETL
jgi:SAM-dependent methyltransferase